MSVVDHYYLSALGYAATWSPADVGVSAGGKPGLPEGKFHLLGSQEDTGVLLGEGGSVSPSACLHGSLAACPSVTAVGQPSPDALVMVCLRKDQ